jgi:ribulose bisphosphate carboxylase small subunit
VPIYQSLTLAYAKAIYLYGSKRFSDIRPEYVEPVKQYAAINYTVEQIDNALAQGWITQQEYDETMTYKNEL